MVIYHIRKTCKISNEEKHYFYKEQEEIDESILCPEHPESESSDFVIERIENNG